jgi:hypothetical protein
LFGQPKISLADLETKLNAAFATRYRPFAGALVSYAYTPPAEDGATLASCRWEFVDELKKPRATVTYPALLLEERWVAIDHAVSELLRVLHGESALGGCRLPEPVSEVEELDTSREPLTGWREVVFEASLRYHDNTYQQVPVVAKGLRPYPSIALAVNDWVWNERSDPRWIQPFFDLGKLRILVPDTRARIRKANWVGSTLTLLNERNAAPEDVELQGVIVERRTSAMLNSGAVEPEVTWEVPSDANVVEVYLIHRDGTLLSHRRMTRGEHYSARPRDFVLRERAEEELRQGEGERVEYKSFITPKNEKEKELIQTVVAFSNTFGGRIYVGVKDDGTPQGEVELRKVGKDNEEQALTLVVRRIENLVRETIKPVPDVEVSPITVAGSPVVVVDVLAGEDAPYSTFEHDVYVRKGASNRKPDPRSELPSIGERARERTERRVRQEQDDAMAASSYQKGDDG